MYRTLSSYQLRLFILICSYLRLLFVLYCILLQLFYYIIRSSYNRLCDILHHSSCIYDNEWLYCWSVISGKHHLNPNYCSCTKLLFRHWGMADHHLHHRYHHIQFRSHVCHSQNIGRTRISAWLWWLYNRRGSSSHRDYLSLQMYSKFIRLYKWPTVG